MEHPPIQRLFSTDYCVNRRPGFVPGFPYFKKLAANWIFPTFTISISLFKFNFMLKKFAFFGLLILVVFSSCKKIEELVSDVLTVDVKMKQEIAFDVKDRVKDEILKLYPGLTIEQIMQLYPDLSIPISEIPGIKESYSYNLDSTIKAETNDNFALSNLKSAKFQEVKIELPADLEINPDNIDEISVTAQANDGSEPFVVRQLSDFKITSDSVNQKKNLFLSTIDTNRDVINQLKASSVEYSIYAKFKNSVQIRLKDEFKLVIAYKLTVKK